MVPKKYSDKWLLLMILLRLFLRYVEKSDKTIRSQRMVIVFACEEKKRALNAGHEVSVIKLLTNLDSFVW